MNDLLTLLAVAGFWLVGFAMGMLTAAPRSPRRPRCPAMIKSGQQCVFERGHEGPHKVTWDIVVNEPWKGQQSFAWNDPDCGLNTEVEVRPRRP